MSGHSSDHGRVGPSQSRSGCPSITLSIPPGLRPVRVVTRASADGDETPLTAREREVIELVSAGATNQEIANALVISESTVKSHVKHILRKLGAANRAEAVSRHLSTVDDR